MPRTRCIPLSTRMTLIMLAALCGCADYRFTVNDRVIYTPAPLFDAFHIPDPALKACIVQHIADASATAPEQLLSLNCSHAGVVELEGLQIFTRLVRLKLSRNAITHLAPLASLTALQAVYLNGNPLTDISALQGLTDLGYLNLSDTSRIPCQQLAFFRRHPSLELVAPEGCAN